MKVVTRSASIVRSAPPASKRSINIIDEPTRLYDMSREDPMPSDSGDMSSGRSL
jgi:hypothetical protein